MGSLDGHGANLRAAVGDCAEARLERLKPAERAVAEQVSVVGRDFEEAALAELPLRPCARGTRRPPRRRPQGVCPAGSLVPV